MSVSPHLAFGSYLRTLRQRRGLSLEAVALLSRRLHDAVSASYLSRCEHGQRLPGVSKLISVSRILDVPTQALIDKLAIENELERLDLAAVSRQRPEQLIRRARQWIQRGYYWECYQASRSIEEHLNAATGALDARMRDVLAEAMILSAWSAARLGRIDLCAYELRYIHQEVAESWPRRAFAMQALSVVLVHQGDLVAARKLADDLHAEAVEREDPTRVTAALMRRAKIAERVDPASPLPHFIAVDRASRAPGIGAAAMSRLTAYALAGMGMCYRVSRRPRAARRATMAFMARAREGNEPHTVDLARLHLGCIEADRGADKAAHRLWSRAAESTTAYGNRPLEFRARYFLLELAERRSQASVAARLRSRLVDLFPWAVEGELEYEAFRRRDVASRQAVSDRIRSRSPVLGTTR